MEDVARTLDEPGRGTEDVGRDIVNSAPRDDTSSRVDVAPTSRSLTGSTRPATATTNARLWFGESGSRCTFHSSQTTQQFCTGLDDTR
jgi:hypothetical protein